MTARLTDHYSAAEFESRHDYALNLEPILSDADMGFLISIWERYRKFGDQMFFSLKQRRYLQMLAVHGGWRRTNYEDAA